MPDQTNDKLIIDLNFRNMIIDESRPEGKMFDSRRMFALITETIIDKRTMEMVEIHDLYKALNHTITNVGAARLFHSLATPSESLELIQAKQEGLLELGANDRLRNAVADFLGEIRKGEPDLFRYLNGNFQAIAPYGVVKKAIKAIENMHKAAEAIPQPETIYLDSLLGMIRLFGRSPESELIRKPTYRTIRGVIGQSEKKWFTPALRYRNGRLSGGSIAPILPCLLISGAGQIGFMNPALAQYLTILSGGGFFLGTLYGGLLKPIFDYETAVLPLRSRFLSSGRFASAIEAIGCLDVTYSLGEFRHSINHATVMPEITDGERHYFEARNLKNPILAKDNPDYVGNDVKLNGEVTFITGPNSGGKTTYCKSVVQSQILGQIGAPVVAEKAKMNIATHIAYQAPAFDSLNDLEGRFGTELRTTRDIFYATTPKSLVILDEIAEGTTSHERMNQSVAILNGLLAKCNSTMLVTHSFELAENFQKSNLGKFMQVEFKNDAPTHQFIPGISRDSHAERISKKINFSPEDITRHLKDNGYI
ncbi:MAG: hypothetical protein OEY01_13010 [Desulfobulbaceae bacterium]|nr:hypothetical protein [Desulfobulbaceae bacterium]HIJ79649.1 hypothetical protein [Deltaproteobacteria bacterium]